jgi:hypothetical protein
MKMLAQINTKKIHNRQIDITICTCDSDHLIVYGQLKDNRLVPTYSLSMERREPTTVHGMRIAMKVALKSLAIVAIETETPHIPHEECGPVKNCLEKIVGLQLKPGFSHNVRQRIGGPKGCIHLTTLLLAMAPAALQGYWTHNDRDPEKRKLTREQMDHYLVDTCYVWRREGPWLKKLTEEKKIMVSE